MDSGVDAGTDAGADAGPDGGTDAGPITYRLTVLIADGGAGIVTSMPAGVDCGATCVAAFDAGTVVTLSQTSLAGNINYGFSGPPGCDDIVGGCSLTMHSDQTVTARFVSCPNNGGSCIPDNSCHQGRIDCFMLAMPTCLDQLTNQPEGSECDAGAWFCNMGTCSEGCSTGTAYVPVGGDLSPCTTCVVFGGSPGTSNKSVGAPCGDGGSCDGNGNCQ